MPQLETRQVTSKQSRRARSGGREVLGACVGGRTRLISRVVTAIYDDMLRSTGLRAGQLTMLAIASCVEEVRSSELVDLLSMDKSTVSRNVKVLAERGWLERVPEGGGRSFGLRLTEAGEQKLLSALPIWRKAQNLAAQRLESEGFSALQELGDMLIGETEHQIDVSAPSDET